MREKFRKYAVNCDGYEEPGIMAYTPREALEKMLHHKGFTDITISTTQFNGSVIAVVDLLCGTRDNRSIYFVSARKAQQ